MPTGIQYPNVIDLATLTPDGEVKLVMVETRLWDGSDERIAELQAKAKGYVHFALDGPLERRFPDHKDRAVIFQLDCIDPPDKRTSRFLRQLQEELGKLGIAFEVNLLTTGDQEPDQHDEEHDEEP